MTPNILKANGLIAVHFTGDNYDEIKEYLEVFDCEFTETVISRGKSFREIYLKEINFFIIIDHWFVYSESMPLYLWNITGDNSLTEEHLSVFNADNKIIKSENIIKREDGSIAFQFTGHNYDEIKPLFDLARVRCECVLPEGSNFPKLFCSVRDVKEHKGIRYQIFPGGWMVYNPDNIGVSHPVYYQDYVYYHCSLDEFIKLL